MSGPAAPVEHEVLAVTTTIKSQVLDRRNNSCDLVKMRFLLFTMVAAAAAARRRLPTSRLLFAPTEPHPSLDNQILLVDDTQFTHFEGVDVCSTSEHGTPSSGCVNFNTREAVDTRRADANANHPLKSL